MVLTIRLNDVLRDAIQRPVRDLVTRPTGAAIRSRIRQAMEATPHPTARLDFGDVGLLDFSCADEVVAKLLRDTSSDRYLVLCDLDDSQADAVDAVLERQDLAVVAVLRGGVPILLGAVSQELRVAFGAVLEGGGDATRLAARLAWTPERAADALQTLALRRLVLAAHGTFSPLPLQ
jgi:hypothetical protein